MLGHSFPLSQYLPADFGVKVMVNGRAGTSVWCSVASGGGGCLFPPTHMTVPGSHLHPQGLTGCLALQKLVINTEGVREGQLDGGGEAPPAEPRGGLPGAVTGKRVP